MFFTQSLFAWYRLHIYTNTLIYITEYALLHGYFKLHMYINIHYWIRITPWLLQTLHLSPPRTQSHLVLQRLGLRQRSGFSFLFSFYMFYYYSSLQNIHPNPVSATHCQSHLYPTLHISTKPNPISTLPHTTPYIPHPNPYPILTDISTSNPTLLHNYPKPHPTPSQPISPPQTHTLPQSPPQPHTLPHLYQNIRPNLQPRLP